MLPRARYRQIETARPGRSSLRIVRGTCRDPAQRDHRDVRRGHAGPGRSPDAQFIGVMVTNSAIGMAQEVRARRTLDRLSLLVAAPASVERDGVTRPRSPDQVALGDVVRLAPSDQLVAMARCLALVISAWTNRCSRVSPSPRTVGAEVRSGAFVVEGTGVYRVSAVGREVRRSPRRRPRAPDRRYSRAARRLGCPEPPRVSEGEASGYGVTKDAYGGQMPQ